MSNDNPDFKRRQSKGNGAGGMRIAASLPSNIEVLGIDSENRIYFYARDMNHVFVVQNLRDIDGPLMVLLCGLAEVQQDVNYRPLIAAEARKRRYKDGDMLGAGVHAVAGVPGVVVNLSDRPFHLTVDGERARITEIRSPTVGGKLIVPPAMASHFPGEELRMAIACTVGDPSRGRDALDEYERVFDCFAFRTGDACQLAAFSAVALIAGALPFRPLVWVSGPSNSGKTATLEVIANHFPHALRMDGESTEAALRQSIGQDSVPVLFDEFEASAARSRVLRVLRSSTRGGSVVKGSPTGRPVRFSLRSMVLVASIDVDLRRDADRNRFVNFELAPSQTPIVVPSGAEAIALGRRVAAAVIGASSEIVRRFEVLSKNPAVREFGRLAEVHAVEVALRAAIRGWSDDDAIGVLRSILAEHHAALSGRYDSDAEALMRDILTSRVSLGGQTWTVAELMSDISHDHDLRRLGIRDTGRGTLFFAPDLIQRHLLQQTRWAEASLGDILAQVPGARRTRLRLGDGVNLRGIELPFTAVAGAVDGPQLAKDSGDAAA